MAKSPQSATARPDPANPLVIDTRDLRRQPGTMRSYERTVPAPETIGLDVVHVPAGEPVELDLRLESVAEGVYLSGTASATVVGECSRCLDPTSDELTVEVAELFAYPDSVTEASTDEDEVSRLVNGLVDTEPTVRDAIVLALPLAPLCREDCPGLCVECGGRRAELGPDHKHDTMDPRWAALHGRLGPDH
ncbi:MAG: DUF177 domain-containing protein [Pseudonocardiales bacterium]|nr:DUF177 domain-containing protein [Pseudonocardiales bacterium]